MNYKSILLGFIFLFLFVQNVNAEERRGLSFKVIPTLSDNQIESVQSYFNMNVVPNQNEYLSIKIVNITEKPITVFMEKANAYTASNGGIDYSGEVKGNLIDERYAMSQYIKNFPSQVKLEAFEEKVIPFHVVIPENMNGTLLGGLLFYTKDQDADVGENTNNQQSFLMKNQIVRAIAIQVNFPKKEDSSISFSDTVIKRTPSGTRMHIGIKNNTANILEEVSGEYKVKVAGKVIFKGQLNSFKMAPKTVLHYPVVWDSKVFKPGKYDLELDIAYDGKTYEHVDTIQIEQEKEKTKTSEKKEDENKKGTFFNIYFVMGIFIFLNIIFFVLKRKK